MTLLMDFLAALTFLTRLGPARLATPERMSRAMLWLPVVGAALGFLLVAPHWIGLFNGKPAVQAFVVTALGLYITRGLHLDGLADVLDGSGAHAKPERFWEIIKDSRVGVFGGAGVAGAVLGQLVIYTSLFAAGEYGAAAWCFIVARYAAVVFGFVTRTLSRPGLGQLFLNGATRPATLIGLVLTVGSGLLLVPIWGLLAAFLVVPACILPLYYLVYDVEGVNGDFLGAVICVAEVAAGIGILMVI